jgi:hypothetical protein
MRLPHEGSRISLRHKYTSLTRLPGAGCLDGVHTVALVMPEPHDGKRIGTVPLDLSQRVYKLQVIGGEGVGDRMSIKTSPTRIVHNSNMFRSFSIEQNVWAVNGAGIQHEPGSLRQRRVIGRQRRQRPSQLVEPGTGLEAGCR